MVPFVASVVLAASDLSTARWTRAMGQLIEKIAVVVVVVVVAVVAVVVVVLVVVVVVVVVVVIGNHRKSSEIRHRNRITECSGTGGPTIS